MFQKHNNAFIPINSGKIMVDIDKDGLLKFLAEAGQSTYAAPKEIRSKHKCKTPILPGHKDYHYENGDWGYHDSYAGSLRAPGREVVFFKGVPVWAMSYQGQSRDVFPEEFFQEKVFPFLKKALMAAPKNMPFRGPARLLEGYFEYNFDMVGDWRYFTGMEKIFNKNYEVFSQDVMGGLIK